MSIAKLLFYVKVKNISFKRERTLLGKEPMAFRGIYNFLFAMFLQDFNPQNEKNLLLIFISCKIG